jgi:hypothetical protein
VSSPAPDERPLTAVELALQQHRGPLIVLLILVPVACWIWIVAMARDMYGPMNGASAWMMTLRWDARHVLLLWLMWAVMMAGMMLPSASPMLLMYGVAARRQTSDAAASRWIYALAFGYLAVWALFSVAATAAQFVLSTQLALSPMMTLTSPRVGALTSSRQIAPREPPWCCAISPSPMRQAAAPCIRHRSSEATTSGTPSEVRSEQSHRRSPGFPEASLYEMRQHRQRA